MSYLGCLLSLNFLYILFIFSLSLDLALSRVVFVSTFVVSCWAGGVGAGGCFPGRGRASKDYFMLRLNQF